MKNFAVTIGIESKGFGKSDEDAINVIGPHMGEEFHPEDLECTDNVHTRKGRNLTEVPQELRERIEKLEHELTDLEKRTEILRKQNNHLQDKVDVISTLIQDDLATRRRPRM